MLRAQRSITARLFPAKVCIPMERQEQVLLYEGIQVWSELIHPHHLLHILDTALDGCGSAPAMVWLPYAATQHKTSLYPKKWAQSP